jgi:RNA polymerase sigma-70 factor (ECF subfamily)
MRTTERGTFVPSDVAEQAPASAPPFPVVYDQTKRFARRKLWSLGVTNEADLTELSQDVFLEVHRGLPNFKPQRNDGRDLMRWISKIAFHIASRHRAKARQTREVLGAETEDVMMEATPEKVTGDSRIVQRLLAGLPLDHRIVFVMNEIEGFELPEIADELGIPEATARTRLRAAREDIRATAARLNKRERVAMLPFGVAAWRGVDHVVDLPDGHPDTLWPLVQKAVERAVAPAAKAALALSGAKLVMVLAGALTVGAIGGGLGVYASMRVRPAPAAIAAEPEVRAQGAPVYTAQPVASAEAPSATATASQASPQAPAASARRFDPDEALLIDQARVALSRHPLTKNDIESALTALSRHEGKYKDSRLRPERDRLRSEAEAAKKKALEVGGGGPIFQ